MVKPFQRNGSLKERYISLKTKKWNQIDNSESATKSKALKKQATSLYISTYPPTFFIDSTSKFKI